MIRFIYGGGGITLIEFLITAAIMTLVISAIVIVYLMSITNWDEGSVQVVLQRNASITMEKMIRGVGGGSGIREASSVTIPNTTTIRYTSGIDGIEKSFYLNGSEAMYDSDTSINNNEFSIAENISTGGGGGGGSPGLTFALNGNMVVINLSMEEQVRDRLLSVDLSTQIKLRN